ncbi:SDR family oxidoreductase [Streptomyces capparidis]
MELTVFGATGGTGGQMVRQALDAGHRVTAVVRDPARLTADHPALEVVTADVTDPAALAPAVAGRDAVLSGLGARGRKGTGIASAAAGAILRAMAETGTRRFLAVSAVPVGPTPADEGVLYRSVVLPLLRAALREVYADLAAMEAEIRRGGAEWTVVRPPRLTDGPVTGRYRTAVGGRVRRGRSISRGDLAHAMLALAADPAAVKQVVEVAY